MLHPWEEGHSGGNAGPGQGWAEGGESQSQVSLLLSGQEGRLVAFFFFPHKFSGIKQYRLFSLVTLGQEPKHDLAGFLFRVSSSCNQGVDQAMLTCRDSTGGTTVHAGCWQNQFLMAV